MTPENFCYWLQGYMELSPSGQITAEQAKVIKEHLQLVFTKMTKHVVAKKPFTFPHPQEIGTTIPPFFFNISEPLPPKYSLNDPEPGSVRVECSAPHATDVVRVQCQLHELGNHDILLNWPEGIPASC